MLVACWSVKGGVGTTVVAASLALQLAREAAAGVVLADLAGDAPAVLGLGEPGSPGIAGWLAAGPGVPADALVRIEIEVTPGLGLLARGHGTLRSERGEVLAALLDRSPRTTVVDCGRLGLPAPAGDADPAPRNLPAAAAVSDRRSSAPEALPATPPAAHATATATATDITIVPDGPPTAHTTTALPDTPPVASVAAVVAARARHSLLVTRPCYVALRRAMQAPLRPTGVVLVNEPGRVLSARDVHEVVRAPVVAQVELDPKVARLVDAGLLTARLPRSLDPLRSAA